MSLTIIIWDHSNVQVWRSKGSSAQILKEFRADNVTDLLTSLDAEMGELKITHLSIYIDLPELDHHIERVPQIALKLRKQLLDQRKIKMYSGEKRVWVSAHMDLDIESAQLFYFISSLPENISSLVSDWAQDNGVFIVGMYSLPQALTSCYEVKNPNIESVIRYQPMAGAGYLIAYDASGSALFFSRVDSSQPSAEKLETIARRLVLFIEQEFSITPRLSIDILVKPDDTALVTALVRQKKKRPLSLILPLEKRRQSLQLIRHRAFAILSIGLIATLYYTIPHIEKKKTLELRLGELQTEKQLQSIDLDRLERVLNTKANYIDVIRFSEGRETIEEGAPVPSPLLVMCRVVSNSLPKLVEIDSYQGQIDTKNNKTVFTMVGRPLSADLDLKSEVDDMYESLKKRGYLIEEPKFAFEESSRYSRFVAQRGELRKFTLNFMLSPKNGTLEVR